MNFAIYRKDTGEIVQTYRTPHSYEFFSLITDDLDYVECGQDVLPSTHYMTDNGLVPYPKKPADYCEFDWATHTWFDPRTLKQVQDKKWEEIKQTRKSIEEGGFTWDGSGFDSDPLSQSRIQGAVQLAQLDSNFSINWTLSDNTTRTLNTSDMINVGITLGQHVDTTHTHSRTLRDLINKAKTIKEVEAITW